MRYEGICSCVHEFFKGTISVNLLNASLLAHANPACKIGSL